MPARRALAVAPVLALSLAAAAPAHAQCSLAKLTASDASAGAFFGRAAALEPGRAVVGARDAAYVFEQGGAGWLETARLAGAAGELFGAAVALDGARAVVGAPQRAPAGGASVFELGPAGWVETEQLAPAGGAGALFGFDVSADGERVLVGAPTLALLGLGGTGSASLYARVPGGWALEAVLVASDGALGDQFGARVALDGDTALVGAPGDDDGGADAGSAYVFERGPAGWVEVARLAASDASAGDGLGGALALSGGTALVGAPTAHGVAHSGAAYVFERDASGWTQTAVLAPPGGEPGERVAHALALSGDTALVGSLLADAAGAASGAAHVFRRSALGWAHTGELAALDLAAGDTFGGAVALAGDTALIGATGDDDGGDASGSAHVQSIAGAGCPPLFAAPAAISVLAGGTQHYALRAGAEHAGRVYLLLGSASGTSPGVPVGQYVLALAPDAYFDFTLTSPNTAPLDGSLGWLDGEGAASASLTVPAGASAALIGLELHHAFCVLKVTPTLLGVPLVSDPVALRLLP